MDTQDDGSIKYGIRVGPTLGLSNSFGTLTHQACELMSPMTSKGVPSVTEVNSLVRSQGSLRVQLYHTLTMMVGLAMCCGTDGW